MQEGVLLVPSDAVQSIYTLDNVQCPNLMLTLVMVL